MDIGLNKRLKDSANHFYLDGFFSIDTDYMGLREAYGRKSLYCNMPIYIEEDNMIIGNVSAGTAQEVVCIFTSDDVHTFNRDKLAMLLSDETVDEHTKKIVSENIEKLKAYDIRKARDSMATPEELLVEESGAARTQGYNGHLAMDFGYILHKGLAGVAEDIKKHAAASVRKEFYEALLVTTEGIQAYIKRHAEYADLLRQSEGNHHRLDTIARVCKNLIEKPAGSFHEAVQMQWFLMMLSDYDSFARYDQYMYPFYARDIDEGKITRDKAKECVKDMIRRVNECGILNMTIGGLTPEGRDAVNDLTYIIMEATRELRFKGPNLCLRIADDSDERLWWELVNNLSTGQALPAIYNDKVFINMMMRSGVKQDDAFNYCLAGCSQAVVPGKSNYSCDVGLYTPAKMLDLAMHNGYDTRLGKQVGPKTGDVTAFTCFNQVMVAYTSQMKYCVEKGAALNNYDMAVRKNVLSCVRTILMPECIEKGLGICEGGSTYYGIQGEVVGLTNVADALMAIKEQVFEKKAMTMEDILQAIDHDFEGYEGIRCKLLNSPKFGNASQEVDAIRAKITKDIYDEICTYPTEFGGTHWPGEVIFVYHMIEGEKVGALPDGRKAWTPLADSAGPSQGRDLNGVTSVLHSCAALPHNDTYYTSINVNLKFPKNVWIEHKSKMIALFKSYFEMGGSQLQINVQDRQALLNAMERPEENKSLIVRVGGFSAYFVNLSREQQLEIVSRTELHV